MSSATTTLQGIFTGLNNLREWVTTMNGVRSVLRERLVRVAGAEILSRAGSVTVRDLTIATGPTGTILSIAAMTSQGYLTTLTLHPKTTHRCTCQDWVQRRRACKHVLAVAVAAETKLGDEVKNVTAFALSGVKHLETLGQRITEVLGESRDKLT